MADYLTMFGITQCAECPKFLNDNWANCPKCRRELKSEKEFVQDLIDAASKTTNGANDGPNFEINHTDDIFPSDESYKDSNRNNQSLCLCTNINNSIFGYCHHIKQRVLYNIPDVHSIEIKYTDVVNKYYAAKHQPVWRLVRDKINRIFGGECIMASIAENTIVNDNTLTLLKRMPKVTLLFLHVKYRREHAGKLYCGVTTLFFTKEEVEKYITVFSNRDWLNLSKSQKFHTYVRQPYANGYHLPSHELNDVHSLFMYLKIYKYFIAEQSLKSFLEISINNLKKPRQIQYNWN